MNEAIQLLKDKGTEEKNITVVCVICKNINIGCLKGIQNIFNKYPNIKIIAA
jgi:uracil phosphoribosyltransferase